MRPRRPGGSISMRLAAFGTAALLVALATVSAQQRQVPGAFRGRVVLVPVDIRVLDRAGNPVTDLTQDDFTVFENDKPQKIGHFSTQALTAASPGEETLPILRRGAGLESTPVTYRTFLLVLGRGRLQGPSDGVTAIIDLVQNRLLPQDHIGVVAYSRGYGLTRDRESVLRLLESFRDRHEEIEWRLDQWFTGMTLRYGSREVPPGIQGQIDELFAAAGVTGVRELTIGDYGVEAFDEFRRMMVERERDAAYDPDRVLLDAREGYDDIRNLFAGIEFLRYLEGEKHIVFLSEWGLSLPGKYQAEGGSWYGVESKKQYDDFARLAADARVTISPIQVGGVDPRLANAFAPVPMPVSWVGRDNRSVAEITGGLSSFHQHADKAVDRVDRATRYQYLLGYYPENANWDGTFRSIRVAVNRPDVTVHYRRGYLSQEELVPYDRREFMSHSRIMAAATDSRFIRDIGVTLAEAKMSRGPDGGTIEVDVQIDPRRLVFREADGQHTAALHVTLFVGDRGERLLGEQWDVLDLRLDADGLARLQKENFVHTMRASFTGVPRHVKAVVYDYRGDRVGTAERAIR